MKRASLVHFLAIRTKSALNIKALFAMKENSYLKMNALKKISPRFPMQDYRLLNSCEFKVKVVAKDQYLNDLFFRYSDTDSYGALKLKITESQDLKNIYLLQIYEIGKQPGLEILLGSYLPVVIDGKKKLVICDFDKTLVHTRYSKPREIYNSLVSPIDKFPTLKESVEILKKFISMEHHPFILSASPHFYEEAMRDWLHAHDIFNASIFLKDYRKIISFTERELSPKDIRYQGTYKFNHLLDIILMTDIPDEIVLMGDNFESDPLIYLAFWELLKKNTEASILWKKLKKYDTFKLNSKQNSILLNKLYLLNNVIKKSTKEVSIKILIRKKGYEKELKVPELFKMGMRDVELFEASYYS